MEDQKETFFFARQPILDRHRHIVAYEFLYRDNAYSVSSVPMPRHATEQVIINALNMSGLSKLLGHDTKAFININEQILFNDAIISVPKDRFVFELLETITYTPEIINRIRELHGAGYTFALDDVVCDQETIATLQPVFPYVNIIKLDLPLLDIKALAPYLERFKKMELRVLAEKVERREDYETLMEAGCDLFQGYFFARPVLVSGKKIDTRMAHIFRIIGLLNQKMHDEAMEVFEQDAALTVQLLRYINCAAFSFKSTIKSVRQAAALLGDIHLKQWLTMLSYAMGAHEGIHSPLLKLAQERANMMRLLAEHLLGKSHSEDAAFLGLLSLIDALFDRPLEELLEELHIDREIIDVLSGRQDGMLKELFDLVLGVEHDAPNLPERLNKLGLSYETFGSIVAESYARTEAFNEMMGERLN